MRYSARGSMPAVTTVFLLGLSFYPQAAMADDAAPKATATRPAQDRPGQTSSPNAAPPATTTHTTGSTKQDPQTKQMNKKALQKIEKEGK